MPDRISQLEFMVSWHDGEIITVIDQPNGRGVGRGLCGSIVAHWLNAQIAIARRGGRYLLDQVRSSLAKLSSEGAGYFITAQLNLDALRTRYGEKWYTFGLSGVARVTPSVILPHVVLGNLGHLFYSIFGRLGYYVVLFRTTDGPHVISLGYTGDHLTLLDANFAECVIPYGTHRAFLTEFLTKFYATDLHQEVCVLKLDEGLGSANK